LPPLPPLAYNGAGSLEPEQADRVTDDSEIRIEPASVADVDAVIRLIGRVFDEYGFVFDPVAELPDLLAFERHYAAPRGAFFVARLDGRVVGSVGVERLPDAAAELHRLYLDADLRGRGLGRALLETVLDWCRAAAVEHLSLWSDTRFDRAHALYERMRFRQTGERELAGDVNNTREFRYEREV
jgi:GNAT superfamily N-acetyltransferase